MDTTKNFLIMGARHALLGQTPVGFERKGDRKTLAIAVYEGDALDLRKFRVCYEDKCVPLMPDEKRTEPNFDASYAKIKKMALDFIDERTENRKGDTDVTGNGTS